MSNVFSGPFSAGFTLHGKACFETEQKFRFCRRWANRCGHQGIAVRLDVHALLREMQRALTHLSTNAT